MILGMTWLIMCSAWRYVFSHLSFLHVRQATSPAIIAYTISSVLYFRHCSYLFVAIFIVWFYIFQIFRPILRNFQSHACIITSPTRKFTSYFRWFQKTVLQARIGSSIPYWRTGWHHLDTVHRSFKYIVLFIYYIIRPAYGCIASIFPFVASIHRCVFLNSTRFPVFHIPFFIVPIILYQCGRRN